MFFSTSLLTALLVACAAASPTESPAESSTGSPAGTLDNGSTGLLPPVEKTLIGYRTVSVKEARSINRLHWMHWDEKKMPDGSRVSGQYGVGKSLANVAGQWPSLQPGAAYFCYVLADTAAFAAAHKVHLPVPTVGKWTEEAAVQAIKAVPAAVSWDPSKVLRFGQCANVQELLIPADMLGYSTIRKGSGPLGLEVHCYKSLKALYAAMKARGIEAIAVNSESFGLVGKRAAELDVRGNKVCKMF